MLFSPRIGKLWLVSGMEEETTANGGVEAESQETTATPKDSADLLVEEVARLKDVFETCRSGDEEHSRFSPVADLAEDVRTLAESTSFTGVRKVTDQLCELVADLDPSESNDVDLLSLHVDALRLVANLAKKAGNSEGVDELTQELSKAAEHRRTKLRLLSA